MQNDMLVFSASILQDYLDCARRFELRYIIKQAWPAVQVEPIMEYEQHIQRGRLFHHFANQFFSGIPQDAILKNISDKKQQEWFMCLVDFSKTFSSNKHFSELRLFAPLERHKIIAIYDLIMQTSAEKIIIFDWKTAMNRPKSRYIFDKPQSLVYPYVLRKNYEALFPGIQQKPHITMIYWYPEFPNDTLRLDYSDERHVETVPLLKDQLNAINKNIEDNHFPLTNNKAKCKYCPYRSLCDRGVFAGELKDLDQIVPAEEEIEINFLDLPALDLHI